MPDPLTQKPKKPVHCVRSLILLVLPLLLPTSLTGFDGSYRQPSAIVLDQAGGRLMVSNQKSGTVSVIALQSGRTAEFQVGFSLRDIIQTGHNRFLVVDNGRHTVTEFRVDDELTLRKTESCKVAPYPISACVSPDHGTVYVSSLWSRQITVLKRDPDSETLKPVRTIDLDFAPRELLLLPKQDRLIVAGNFSGRMAVIDTNSHKVQFVHRTTGHNIRGLGTSPDGETILVAHQMLNELAHTSRNDIHWGLLMSNDLRWFKTDAFLRQVPELYRHSHMHPLGKEGHAAGDPGQLAVAPDGTVVVTLSGVNEIAIGKENDFWLQRVKTGKRPVDVVLDSANRRAYVANAFDDSVSVLDLDRRKIVKTLSLGKLRELTDVEEGEQLFFDARLSHDGWMSCQSCHTDGHSNGGLNDNFTDGSFGAPKKVLSLLGRANTEPLGWNGRQKDFESQIRFSITSTMQAGDPPDDRTVRLLADYVKSLQPPPSLAEARGELDPVRAEAGRKVFRKVGCVRCHQPPSFTSPATYDVGLKDEEGNRRFNPPPLSGVSQREIFFHDGRAKTLRDVLFRFRHQLPRNMDPQDRELLLSYLQSL